MRRRGDRLGRRLAVAGLDWAERRVDESRREWIRGMRAELVVIDSGLAQVLWALGAVVIVAGAWRMYLVRAWNAWPTLLRMSSFGLGFGGVLLVLIVWSTVIAPGNESDDEYGAWYAVFFLSAFAYCGVVGAIVGGRQASPVCSILTGALTAFVSFGLAVLTFAVVDNAFLEIVMQQPDKIDGFSRSGMVDARAYVNQGLLTGALVGLPVFSIIGAACGAIGGIIRSRALGLSRGPVRL